MFYGYHSWTPNLIEFNPETDETFQILPFPTGQFAETVRFHAPRPSGRVKPDELLLYCFTALRPADAPPPPGAVDALFSVNVVTGAVMQITEAPALAVGDMTSCVMF